MIWRLTKRSLMARKGRTIGLALSIVIGVAFVAGAFLVSDSLRNTFDELFAQINKGIDLQVRGKGEDNGPQTQREPVPAELLAQIQGIDGVEQAGGSLVRSALIIKDGKPITTAGPGLGVSWSNTSSLGGTVLAAGRLPSGSGEIAMDARTARVQKYELGAPVTVALPGGVQTFTLVGTANQGDEEGFAGASVVAWDPLTAAAVLGAGNTFDTIDIGLAADASEAAVLSEIQRLLPVANEVITGDALVAETSENVGGFVTALRTGLLIFAFITLFVSAFIINNVFSITIGQRMRELALMRAVGASGKQVRRMIIAEALVIAIVATAIGLLAGFGVSALIVWFLNSLGGFPKGSTVLLPHTVIAAVAVGVGTTLLSVLIPSRKASRIPPVAAMQPQTGFAALTSARRLVVGTAVAIIGVVLFLLGIFTTPGSGKVTALIAGGGALMIYLGISSLITSIARPVSNVLGAPLAKIFGTPGRLSKENAARAPRRTAATASALVIGISLVTAAAVLGESVKSSFREALGGAVKADYFVQSTSFDLLPATVADEVAALPIFAAVTPARQIPAAVGDAEATLNAVDAATIDQMFDVEIVEGSTAGLENGILVYSGKAEDLGIKLGDSLDVTFGSGTTESLPVVGLYDNNYILTDWVISTATFDRVTDSSIGDFLVVAKLAPGATAAQAEAAFETLKAKYPQMKAEDQAAFQESVTSQIDTLVGIISAFMIFAFVIALIGIAITLALSVYERTREIGLLRSVGMGRRQVRRMIRWEAVIVTVFGASVGLLLGVLLGLAVSSAIPESVITSIGLPIGLIVIVLAVSVVAGLAAAIYPAWKASRLNVLEALAAT